MKFWTRYVFSAFWNSIFELASLENYWFLCEFCVKFVIWKMLLKFWKVLKILTILNFWNVLNILYFFEIIEIFVFFFYLFLFFFVGGQFCAFKLFWVTLEFVIFYSYAMNGFGHFDMQRTMAHNTDSQTYAQFIL